MMIPTDEWSQGPKGPALGFWSGLEGAVVANQWAIADGKGGSTPAATSNDPGWDQVCQALKGIRFGEVRVIVQDGLIVQIERLEKQRVR